MKIHRRKDYRHSRLSSKKTGEQYSYSAVLSDALGSRDFFVHHEVIPPGVRSSAPHFHRETDEFFYLLKGAVTAVEGEERMLLETGDCACFAAGSGVRHFLANESEEDAEVLVVTRKLSADDTAF